jgi:transposase
MVKQHLRRQLKRRPRRTPRRVAKAGFIAPPADQSRRAAASLPRKEIVIDIADKTCAGCGASSTRIGEDLSERLDVIPAQLKVIVSAPQIRLPRLCMQDLMSGARSK